MTSTEGRWCGLPTPRGRWQRGGPVLPRRLPGHLCRVLGYDRLHFRLVLQIERRDLVRQRQVERRIYVKRDRLGRIALLVTGGNVGQAQAVPAKANLVI